MKRKILISAILLYGIFQAPKIAAVPEHYELSNTDGLSNSSIICVTQDSVGRLWIGTWDGLNVYDSKEFWVWRYEPDNHNSISNNIIRDIQEETSGIVWVTTDDGINRIDTGTSTVKRFYLGYDNTPPLSEKTFSCAITEDRRVFASSTGWGIAFYDSKSERMIPFNITGLNTTDITAIYDGGREHLIIKSSHGLVSIGYRFTDEDKIEITDRHELYDNSEVSSVFSSKDYIFIVRNNDTISRYSKAGFDIDLNAGIPVKGRIDAITQIGKDSVAIGTYPQGLYITDLEKKELSWVTRSEKASILSLYYGTQNTLWVGTDGLGLWAFYDDEFNMNKVPYSTLSPAGSRYPVRAFYSDGNGKVFVGTKGGGLFLMQNGRQVRSWSTANGLDDNSIYSLCQGYGNDIFIGHENSGINIISGASNSISRLMPPDGHNFQSVYCLLNDKANGYLWLGTYGYGLVRLKLEYGSGEYKIRGFKSYTSSQKDSLSLNNNMVQALEMQGDSILWIGTRGGGLNKMDIRKETFSHYTAITGVSPISSNDILSLYLDGKTLWIGTGYGLNRLDLENSNHDFEIFSSKKGLINNTVHGIEGDNSGNLWLSTNKGLSVFNIATEKFTNYYNDSSLQDNEYSDGAYFKDNAGIIWFGGINGYNWFDPTKIKARSYSPQVLISGLTLSENPHTDLLKDRREVKLKYNQNFFDIHYTALEYIDNRNCEYAYKLDGFNQDWIYPGTETVASFTNVPHGEYTFRVRCTNGDKVWSDKVSAIRIRVLPPWWLTGWAYTFYIIMTIAAAFGILMSANARIRRKHKQEIDAIKSKQIEETYEAKLTFFTNIAHEFTTPLTLICGPLEQIESNFNLPPKVEKYNKIIRNNAERLLRLIEELIEFRRVDTGNRKPEYSSVNLSETINSILDNFSEMNDEQQIQLSVDLQASHITSDHNALEKILYNLISNAYKYTPAGGKISISTKDLPEGTQISVTNSGKGIKPENLNRVFDRFVILDNFEKQASKGTVIRNGIGMALVSSLVKMMSGKIEVASEPDKYTEFTVTLPHVEPTIVRSDNINIKTGVPDNAELMDIGINDNAESEKAKGCPEKKILIVDDEKQIRDLVSDILSPEYEIIQASDGNDALEKIKQGIPDMVITDINMPGMNGIELLKHLRTNALTKFIPVVFLAFKTDIKDEIETYELGSEAFIPKPFHAAHLASVVHSVFNNRLLMRDYYSSSVSSIDMYEGESVDNEDKKFMLRLTELIEQNITDENLSPLWLCEKMLVSRMQMYRKIKELAQQTPSEFIRNVKINHAVHLLKTTNLTVQEIMYSSGFNNKSYFYREFAEKYHMSPKEFRKENR